MRSDTPSAIRVLLIVDACNRSIAGPVSDLDLARLFYFVDAFSELWGLRPLDSLRLKSDEPRSLVVRRSLDLLVLSGILEPTNVSVVTKPRPHVSARYVTSEERQKPILQALGLTQRGKREMELVDEVVYASAGFINGQLGEALRLDAGQVDDRKGPNDLINLEASPTSATAQRFLAGVSSKSWVEAELTHLYMSHIQRLLLRD